MSKEGGFAVKAIQSQEKKQDGGSSNLRNIVISDQGRKRGRRRLYLAPGPLRTKKKG